MGQQFQDSAPHALGPRERRRQLHFQRTFSKNVLEATITAAVKGETPGPSLLRTFAALERATQQLHKPATIALSMIRGERHVPIPDPRDPTVLADAVPRVLTARERRRALAEMARDDNLPADLSA